MIYGAVVDGRIRPNAREGIRLGLGKQHAARPNLLKEWLLRQDSNQQRNIVSMTCRATDDTKGYGSSRWAN
jgi:hypothetical protein